MLFGNPEGLKTYEEIIQITIDGMTPETRSWLEEKAHALGCSLHEAAVATLIRAREEGLELPNSDWER